MRVGLLESLLGLMVGKLILMSLVTSNGLIGWMISGIDSQVVRRFRPKASASAGIPATVAPTIPKLSCSRNTRRFLDIRHSPGEKRDKHNTGCNRISAPLQLKSPFFPYIPFLQ